MIINRALNHREYLLEQNAVLLEEIALQDSTITHLRNIVTLKDSISIANEGKLGVLTYLNEDLQRSLTDQRKRSRKTIAGVGAGGILVGVLLGILLINN